MSDQEKQAENGSQPDVKNVVRHVIEEFMRAEQSKAEPAYKAELIEERKRREALEGRLNQLVEENRQARATAEQMDRHSQISDFLPAFRRPTFKMPMPKQQLDTAQV